MIEIFATDKDNNQVVISKDSKITFISEKSEFRISFDTIDEHIIIKEVSGCGVGISPMSTNSIRIKSV